jgi:phage terminase large subunit-like protein
MLHPSRLKTTADYEKLSAEMEQLRVADPKDWAYRQRVLCQTDLPWLLSEVLTTRWWMHPEFPQMPLFRHQFAIDTAHSIQNSPGDELYIISRGHLKTTTLVGRQIQVVLNDPNACMGTFSITKDLAEMIVGQIATELEVNEFLKNLFEEIFYEDPVHESPNWSKKSGLQVKRPMVYKDPTFRPFGLLDSVSTGARMSHLFYDDCVNEKAVTNAAMIQKANERWEMTLNLGYPGTKRYYVGTFYAQGDTYHHMVERGVKLNLHSCYEIDHKRSRFNKEGIPVQLVVDRNRPVLYTRQFLEGQEKLMGQTMFAIQMLCTPLAVEIADFKPEWVRRYTTPPEEARRGMNVCFLVDPAYSKGQNSHSRTAIAVVGLNNDNNYYLLDGVLDRLNLGQRLDIMFELHQKYKPWEVRYEQNGWGSDLEAFRIEMERRNYRFSVVPVHPQSISKNKRIERLVPILRAGRFFVPSAGIPYLMKETNQRIDLVQWWIEKELIPFPNVVHLDFSDALSRIEEPDCSNLWPRPKQQRSDEWRAEFYKESKSNKLDWMRM